MAKFQSSFFSSLLVATILLLAFSFSVQARAGECKVDDPTPGMIADGAEMARLTQDRLRKIEKEYKAKTGRTLEVVIVARAGQNLKDQSVLRDETSEGLTSLKSIYEAGLQDPDSYLDPGERSQFDFGRYNEVIRNKHADPFRKMEFSHVGFMVRNHPKANDDDDGGGKWWWARHMLRPCKNKKAESELEHLMNSNLNVPYLWNEGPGNFFADDPYELKARFIIPSPQMQARLLEVVLDDKLGYQLNSKFYNAAANWQNTAENNSNQWVLEMVAAATQPRGRVQSRAEAQDVLRKLGYRPTKLLFVGQKAMAYLPGAHKIAPYLTYRPEEHPYYFKGSIGEVITALSVEEFMQRNGLVYESRSTPAIERHDDIWAREKAAKKKIDDENKRATRVEAGTKTGDAF